MYDIMAVECFIKLTQRKLQFSTYNSESHQHQKILVCYQPPLKTVVGNNFVLFIVENCYLFFFMVVSYC